MFQLRNIYVIIKAQFGTKSKAEREFFTGRKCFILKIEVPRFMSIREVAKTGLLTEYTLRLMEKQNRLPCVYTGRKCLINFDRLVEQLNNPAGKGSDSE